MPQHAATIESLPMAFEMVKGMQADGLDWGEGYRPPGCLALADGLELSEGYRPAGPPCTGRDHRGADGRGGRLLARRPRR